MAVRIVVELTAGADWQETAERLRSAAGTDGVLPPTEEMTESMIALFPAETDPSEAAERARAVPGIDAAYPDTWKFAHTLSVPADQ
ncbi:hypothetical protein ACF9IK_34555 [Kitasatospora hibisci]|uniref:hypothetical protein n=1 Tax=Kitasatospora hibisci TaxID=3369522 RepID=UPI0037549A01